MSDSAHVLPKHMGGGPHGLGDPDNKSLRRVEIEVLIPKIMRERTKAEKCVPEVAAFEKCCQSTGISMVVKCRAENDALKQCSMRWFRDEDFREECKQIYLEKRSEYRRTGLNTKQKAAAEAVAANEDKSK